MQSHDNIFLAVVRADDLDIAVRETSVTESLRHRLGCGRNAADRVSGVDLNELFEDVVRQLAGGGVVHLRGNAGSQEKHCDKTKQFGPIQRESPWYGEVAE